MPSLASKAVDFPYESKYANVLGSKIHYIEQGSGDPIVFLHGIPTSNYLWRNIIPALASYGHCIAPDFIGMGKSDKPDIPYRIFDHIHYIERFIDALGLQKVTLVVHGWGSVVGFDFAARHPSRVKALAFTEGFLRGVDRWDMVALPAQELLSILKSPDKGYKAIVEQNYLLEKALPAMLLQKLEPQAIEYYRAPFLTPESRRPLWQYLKDLPLPDGPDDVKVLIKHYMRQLKKMSIPKLMIYTVPGFITPMGIVNWARIHLPNLKLVEIGEGLNYPQETDPVAVSEALVEWYKEIV